MPALTRRREKHRHQEYWQVFCGDVCVGDWPARVRDIFADWASGKNSFANDPPNGTVSAFSTKEAP
jgi:hypothetical protein